MAEAVEIDGLELNIAADDTSGAVSSLSKLSKALDKLKTSLQGSFKFTELTGQLKGFDDALGSMKNLPVIEHIAESVKALESISKKKIAVPTVESRHMRENTPAYAVPDLATPVEEAMAAEKRHISVLDRVKSKLQEISSANERVKKTTDEASSGFGKFLGLVKRLFVMRILRMGIMGVINEIKSGFEALAKFSPQVQKTMSGYKTDFKYLANSIVTAIYPIINALFPAVDSIVDTVANAISYVAQFFSYLGGGTTYFRAKKVMVEYGNETEAATEKVEKLKKSILGFDQLNVLSSSQDATSEAAKSATNGADMFEELPIDKKLIPAFEKVKRFLKSVKKSLSELWDGLVDTVKWLGEKLPFIGDFIKEHAGEILTVLSALAIAKVAKDLLTFVSSFGTIGKLLAGGLGIVIGAKLSYDAGKAIGSGKATFTDWIKGALGIAVAGIGGYVAFGTTGMIIGVAVSIVTTFIGIAEGSYQRAIDRFKSSPEYERYIQSIKDLADVKDVKAKIDMEFEPISEGFSQLFTDYYRSSTLIDQIYDLAEKPLKTEGDISILNSLIKEFNSLNVSGVSLSYDNLTNSINLTRKAAKQLTEEFFSQAFTHYAAENLAKTYFDIEQYRNAWSQAAAVLDGFSDFVDARDKLQNAANHFGYNSIEAFQNSWEGGAAGIGTNILAFFGVDDAKYVQDLLAIYETEKEGYEDAAKTVEELKNKYYDAVDLAKQFTGILNGTLIPTINDVGEIDFVTPQTKRIMDGIGEWTGGMKQFAHDVENLNPTLHIYAEASGAYTTASQVISAVNSATATIPFKANAKQLWQDIEDIYITVGNTPLVITAQVAFPETVDLGWATFDGAGMTGYAANDTNGNTWFVPRYADGAYDVPAGQMFIANEAGPELVGTINGKTSVANNGQIVEGISRGVYDAFMRANGGNSGDIVINNYNDGQLSSTKIISASDRANRRAGKTVLTVGR